mgnify:FL=1
MSLDYEKKKSLVLKEMISNYQKQLLVEREETLKLPIETENGFNVEREAKLIDIDEKMDILKRHEKDPYFAKLIFTDTNDNEEFMGYIGRVSVGDIQTKNDEKIVDWRAPIADLYYNGRVGNSSYVALNKEYNVDLKLKRQIVFKNGEVSSIYDFEDKISNDEFLTPFLTQSADNRLKSIVSTIQEEQNKIIRLPISKNMVVQGVAGSGKTTVALHRLSYLIYNYKKYANADEFLIISPNEIFMSYISSILVDLEADKSNSFSLNKVFEFACGTEFKLLNKHTKYEMLQTKKISTDYLSYKSSKEFAMCIDKFVFDYLNKLINKPLIVKGVKILDALDVLPYFKNNNDLNLNTLILNASRKIALELEINEDLQLKAFSNVNKSDSTLTKKYEIKRLIESGNFGYVKNNYNTNFKLFNIYKEFISSIEKYSDYKELDILKKQTLNDLKNKTLAYEDMSCLLYLYSKLTNIPYFEKLKCVFIDEAQDLSYLMFLALRKLFKNAKFSIFGDIAQGIYSYESINSWDEILDVVGNCELMYLDRSYRTSIEIMQEANKTLQKLNFKPANNVVRHGEEVEFNKDCNLELIKNQLKVLNEKYNNTAIICKDGKDLEKAIEMLSSLNLIVLDENNLSYNQNQNTILTVQTAKGLEFDSVIIFNEQSYLDNSLDLKLLYVAKTRALHKLIINGCKN